MSITIDHLTPVQCAMLEFMWTLDSAEAFEEWVVTLAPEDQQLALSLRELVVMEVLERELTSLEPARALLEQFRLAGDRS